MPEIGRFGLIDPLAEVFMPQSPYVYSANNPILLIDRNGLGPEDLTKPNFSYTSSNGNLIVSRITTTDRVIGEVSKAIVQTNAVASGFSTLLEIIEVTQSSTNQEVVENSINAAKDIAIDGFVQPFEHAAREAAEGGGPTTKQLNGLAKFAKSVGKVDDAWGLYKALTLKPTSREIIESWTFQVALKSKIITSINNRKGYARFNKKTTKQQGMLIMNSIYRSLNNIFSGFNLEEDNENEVAQDYFQGNYIRIMMDISIQIQLEMQKEKILN